MLNRIRTADKKITGWRSAVGKHTIGEPSGDLHFWQYTKFGSPGPDHDHRLTGVAKPRKPGTDLVAMRELGLKFASPSDSFWKRLWVKMKNRAMATYSVYADIDMSKKARQEVRTTAPNRLAKLYIWLSGFGRWNRVSSEFPKQVRHGVVMGVIGFLLKWVVVLTGILFELPAGKLSKLHQRILAKQSGTLLNVLRGMAGILLLSITASLSLAQAALLSGYHLFDRFLFRPLIVPAIGVAYTVLDLVFLGVLYSPSILVNLIRSAFGKQSRAGSVAVETPASQSTTARVLSSDVAAGTRDAEPQADAEKQPVTPEQPEQAKNVEPTNDDHVSSSPRASSLRA